MIRAALDGRLAAVEYERDAVFNVDVPVTCPDVPSELLRPRRAWPSEAEYDIQARKLARMFADNFRAFEAHVPREVRDAGPRT
jgi:phosphoenolpyruvate carboxykinase (ATP)